MRLLSCDGLLFTRVNWLKAFRRRACFVIGACLAGGLSPALLTQLCAADDIVIDGTSHASPAVLGDTTATATVALNNNVTVSAATGSTVNLAGANNQVILAANEPAGETITFGSVGNAGIVIVGGGSSDLTGSPHIVIAYGTVQISGNTLFWANALDVVINGTLDLNGADLGVNLPLLQGTGAIVNSAVNSTGFVADMGNSSSTFDGTISGALRMFVAGSATSHLTLTNVNSYTGGTQVAGSTLEVSDLATNLGSGGITLASGGTLFTHLMTGTTTTANQDLHVEDGGSGTLLTSDGTAAYYRNLSGAANTTLNVGNGVHHAAEIGFSGSNTGFEGVMNVAGGMTVGVLETDALGSAAAQFVTGAGVDPVTLKVETSNPVTLHNTFDLSANDLFITTNQVVTGVTSLTLTNTISDGGNGHGLFIYNAFVTIQGINSYSGGTSALGSFLFFSQDQNLGSSAPAVTLNNSLLAYAPEGPAGQTLVSNATLAVPGNSVLSASTGNTVVYQGNASGAGALIIGNPGLSGYDGHVVLVGNNTRIGTVVEGWVGVGSDTALGSDQVQLLVGQLQTYGAQRVIHVATDFSQSGGTLYLNASGTDASQHDELVVGGTAHLSGFGGTSSLYINLLDGYHPSAANPLVVLEAGMIDGMFDQVLLSNGKQAIVSYTPTQILIYQLLFGTTPGLTPNQRAVADNLDNFTPGVSPAMLALINELAPAADTAALAPLLNQLSPQALQVLGHVAFDNTTFATQRLNNHLANVRDGLSGFDGSQLTYSDPSLAAPLARIQGRLLAWNPFAPGPRSDAGTPLLDGRASTGKHASAVPANRWSTFLSGDVVVADANRNADLSGQDYTTGGVALGGDYRLTRELTLGVQFAYDHTEANLDGLGSGATIDSYSPGLYVSYVDGGWYANGSLAYSYDHHEENRNVQIGGVTGVNRGTALGDHSVANFTGGYEFERQHWKLGVIGGLQYVELGIGSFTESGPTALTIDRQDAESLRTQFGLTARYLLPQGSVTFTPHGSVTWQHELLDDSRGITSQLNGSGTGSFTVATSRPERDSALINLGLNAEITRRLTLFADYITQVGQANFFAQSVQAGLRVGF